jgi:hypothetical protein
MSMSIAVHYSSQETVSNVVACSVEKEEEKNFPHLFPNLGILFFSFLDKASLVKCSLVNKEYAKISANQNLWIEILKKLNFSEIKAKWGRNGGAWKYRKVSLQFIKTNRFHAAFVACEKCAQLDASVGAFGFRDLCIKMCKIKNYEVAARCQELANSYFLSLKKKDCFVNPGYESMSHYIQSRVEDSNFLEKSEELIQLSLTLIDDDREFGLQALMTIVKKFADLKMFEKAMALTQQARNLRDQKECKRERNHGEDIEPFVVMGKHLVSLKQYQLAEECARKIDFWVYNPHWIYKDIVIKQIREENFVNESLFSKIRSISWIEASEGLVWGLIDHERYDEAQKIAKSRLSTIWDGKKDKFKLKLGERLKSIGIDPDLWLS